MMLYSTTMPVIMMMPMKVGMLRFVPVRNSTSATPTKPNGMLNIMMRGTENDRSWATMARYTRMTAMTSPSENCLNDLRMLWTSPRMDRE